MRKFTYILIGFFYLVLSVGVSVNLHYCHGKLVDVELAPIASKCCCDKRMAMKDCCDDNTLTIVLEEDHQVPDFFRFLQQNAAKLEFHSPLPLDPESMDSLPAFTGFEPPPPQKQPRWLLNCNLTYYA